MPGIVLLGFALMLGLVPAAARGETIERKMLPVTRTEAKITIDGVIGEAEWSEAAVVDSFLQVEPDEGAAPTERTLVRVLFDDDFLYLAFRMYDSDPSALIAKQMVLDGVMTGDDRINLSFDTFDDHRNAYFFQINAIGTRSEGLVENNSKFRRDWNGIWYAEAKVDSEGWTAEFAIPFKTVAYAVSEEGIWGFEAERIVRRKNEKTRWGNYSNNRSVTNVAGIGALKGLVNLSGTGVDVKPSGSLRTTYSRNRDPLDGTDRDNDFLVKASGDVFYKFHPSVTAGVTVNTDFHETPVDDFRTILSRFPPLLVERRAFFLQDAGIFEFGGITSNGIPYRTRKVGRARGGDPLDIDAGLKLTGRLGNSSFGGLYVHLPAQEGLEAADLAVGRVQYNVLGESAVGLIGTIGNPRDEIDNPADNFNNGLIGADFQYSNSHILGNSILKGTGYFMQSITDGSGETQQAFGLKLDFPNDRYQGSISYLDFGSGFNPALGSAFRTGIRQVDGNVRYRVRTKRYLRTIDTALTTSFVANRKGQTETRLFALNFLTLTTADGDSLAFAYTRDYENLRGDTFGISNSVQILGGSYTFDRYAIKLDMTNARAVRPTVEMIWGTYYSGKLRQLTTALELRPVRYLFVSFEYSQNNGSLDEGDFTQRLARIRTQVSFTSEISWSSVLQYENVNDRMGLNSILRWEVEPGNDVYLVFNYEWEDDDGRLATTFTDTAVKVAWTFRF